MGKGLILFRRQFFMRELENCSFREGKNVNKDWRKTEHFLAKYQLRKTNKKNHLSRRHLFFNIPINGALLRCPVGI